jgi:hypothetical protein
MNNDKTLDFRSKLILYQNLLNRATDIAIAKFGKDIDVEKIESILDELSKLTGKKIKNM